MSRYGEILFRQRYGFGCEPATLLALSLAASAAGATATVQGQRAQGKAQTNYQNELMAANNAVAHGQTSALRIQESQDAESRTREMEKARLVTQKARSSAVVAAGEGGVGGNTVDALLNEYNSNLGTFREATMRQGTLNSFATTEQVKAIQTNARYGNLQINSPVARPNYASEAVGFLGGALKTYGAYLPEAKKNAGKTGGKG